MKTKLISRNLILRFYLGKGIQKSKYNVVVEDFDHQKYYLDKEGNWYNSNNQRINDIDLIGRLNKMPTTTIKPKLKVNETNKRSLPDPNRTLDPKKKHDYGQGEVDWKFYNGNWYVKFRDPNNEDLDWYKVTEGTTGYDLKNNRNVFKGGKWVPIPKNSTTSTNKKLSSNTISNSNNSSKTTTSSLTPEKYVDYEDRGKLLYKYMDRLDSIDTNPDSYSGGGLKGKSIRGIQQILNKWLKDNGYNYTLEENNIWNDKTEEVYQKYRQSYKPQLETNENKANKLEEVPLYKSGDYNNLSYKDISDLGFDDYENLRLWTDANRDSHWFARDLIERFGDPGSWDLQEVENLLNVKGKYKKSFLGTGDYADMFNSMKNYFSIYKNVNTPRHSIYLPVTVSIPNYKDWTNGFYTNQLNDPYRKLYKKGGIISNNPILRFKQNLTKIKF